MYHVQDYIPDYFLPTHHSFYKFPHFFLSLLKLARKQTGTAHMISSESL